jgi:hypothetical protein
VLRYTARKLLCQSGSKANIGGPKADLSHKVRSPLAVLGARHVTTILSSSPEASLSDMGTQNAVAVEPPGPENKNCLPRDAAPGNLRGAGGRGAEAIADVQRQQ